MIKDVRHAMARTLSTHRFFNHSLATATIFLFSSGSPVSPGSSRRTYGCPLLGCLALVARIFNAELAETGAVG